MLLLQVSVADTIITRLSDQAFSIVLLFAFAMYMLKKQKALEDKLDKYMSEDREEMKDVIAKNTQAFDNLSARFASKIISILLLCLSLGSCKTTKTITSTSHADTAIGLKQYQGTSIATSVHRYAKDTIIYIQPRTVSGLVAADGLEIARTKDGNSVPRSYQMSRGGLTAYLVRDSSGLIRYGCTADSLNIVLSRMVTDSIVHSEQYDSLRILYALTRSDTQTHTKAVTTGLPWWAYLIAVIILVVGVIWSFVKTEGRI